MRVLSIAFVLLVLGPLAACGSESGPEASEPAEPETFDVMGALMLADDEMDMPSFDRVQNNCNFDAVCRHPAGKPCAPGSPGYSDITEGAQVRITDASGEVVALGALGPGRSVNTPDIWNVDGWYPPCAFAFVVSDVPDSGGIYGVEVSSRGVVQFTKAEAQALTFSLGG